MSSEGELPTPLADEGPVGIALLCHLLKIGTCAFVYVKAWT